MAAKDDARYWTISAAIGESGEGNEAQYHSERVNAKASALLTHVSLMVAVSSGFFLALSQRGAAKNRFVPALLFLEIITYIVSALFCLRSIWITNNRSFSKIKNNSLEINNKDVIELFKNLVVKRRNSYLIALKTTVATTILFIMTLFLEIGPFLK